MPLYGANQSGYNLAGSQGLNITAVFPGNSCTLLAGTADGTPSTSTKSVSFARGYAPTGDAFPITFNVTGAPTGTTIDVQVAGADIDGQYTSVNTMTPDAGGNSYYTDIGRSPFLRVKISAYTSGNMATVVANA